MVQHLCIGEAVRNDKGLETEEMDLRMLLVDSFWCVLLVLGTGECLVLRSRNERHRFLMATHFELIISSPHRSLLLL